MLVLWFRDLMSRQALEMDELQQDAAAAARLAEEAAELRATEVRQRPDSRFRNAAKLG